MDKPWKQIPEPQILTAVDAAKWADLPKAPGGLATS